MVLAGLLYVQGLLYMLYVPSKETFVANATHYLKVSLQKSESLRAEACYWLGEDNYVMNKLRHQSSYRRKSSAIIGKMNRE